MKDALGHGSDSRMDGGTKVFGGRSMQFQVAPQARFAAGVRSPGYQADDTKRTISDLRSRMSNTGSGHMHALWQGIKNLAG